MARGRMLNNSISCSLKFDLLPDDTCRLLATWIISHLDCHGVFHADPGIVKSLVFTRRDDVTIGQVDEYLQAMSEIGLISLFATSDGQRWQCWPGFSTNQIGLRAEREKTNYPMPPAIRQEAGKVPEKFRQEAGKESAEVKLSEGESEPKRKEHGEDAALVSPNGNSAVGDASFDDIMGPRQHPVPQGEVVQSDGNWRARLQDKPWLNWSDGKLHPRANANVEAQEHVAWILESITTRQPTEKQWKLWGSECAAIYETARGDFDIIRAGIQRAWEREPSYRPRDIAGFAKEVATVYGEKRSKAKEYQRAQQRMAEDPQAAVFRQLREARECERSQST